MKQWMHKKVQRIAQIPFIRKAIEESADLSAFKAKPTPKILAGIFCIGLSYVICWPVITVLGYLSLHFRNPWLVTIGGPLFYGLSHLVFMLGMVLSGAEYSVIFLRWLVRISVQRMLAWAEK